MTELVIIKTASTEKLKTVLDKNLIKHEIIYNEPLTAKKSSKKDKLRERSLGGFSKLRQYIEMKSKEDIFASYGEAIKDKEREKELALWEQADEEDEEELSKKHGRQSK